MQRKCLKFGLVIMTFIVSFFIFRFDANASVKQYKIRNVNVVGAVTDDLINEKFDVCKSSGIVKTFQIIGYCLFIIKIVVPILLIVMGSVDFAKAMIANDPNDIKNAFMMLAKRGLAGVVIFFIPTIVAFVFSVVDKANTSKDFECLTNCISLKNCVIPNDGGVFSK